MDNMALYNAVRAVPANAQKPFDKGTFKGTDINPMWRIKVLTEQFGVCGVGWYYEVLSERSEVINESTIIAIVDINLYIRANGEWSKPIYGTGGNLLMRNGKASDEGYKMALTDAISVACKQLGIGADIYYEQDKTKYTNAETVARKLTNDQSKIVIVDDATSDTVMCDACGLAITDVTFKDGRKMTKADLIKGSRERYGKTLCYLCCKDQKK